MEEGDYAWDCEFCGTHNVLTLDEEELPKNDITDYVLQTAPVTGAGGAAGATAAGTTSGGVDDAIIVFCVDISGSMCVTSEVKGKVKLRGHAARDKQLAALRQAGDSHNQAWPGMKSDVTYVSRLQAVQASIADQIEQIKQAYPTRRVALVTFSDEVTLMGDSQRVLAGTRLDNYEQLVEAGASLALAKSVDEVGKELVEKVYALEEGGATALGPALLASVAIAGRRAGSKVVLATDGLSNVGLGALDSTDAAAGDAAEAFYTRVGNLAKSKGVVIDVVGIEGEGCDVETLTAAVATSGGEITKVNPLKLADDFTNMLAVPPVATRVEVTVFLHRGLTFRNVDAAEDTITSGGYVLKRSLGTVTADTDFTVEYGVRSHAERRAHGLGSLKELCFQVQVEYSKFDGSRCVRVISQSKPITRERQVAEKSLNTPVLASHCQASVARLARRGSYSKSRQTAVLYGQMMARNAVTETTQRQVSAWMTDMRDLDTGLRAEMAAEADDGLSMDSDSDDDASTRATKRATRLKVRKTRRRKQDFLSAAIHKNSKGSKSRRR